MTANVVPLKYDTSVSPLLVHKDHEHRHQQSTSGNSTGQQHLLLSTGSSKSDSGCYLSPVSVSYDVKYDYRSDKITVIKIENFSSPEPSPLSAVCAEQRQHTMNANSIRTDATLVLNGNRSDQNFEFISAQNLLQKSERRLKRSVTFREDTIDINEEIAKLRPEHSLNDETNSSQVSSEGQPSSGEVINLTPISLTVIILLSVSLKDAFP